MKVTFISIFLSEETFHIIFLLLKSKWWTSSPSSWASPLSVTFSCTIFYRWNFSSSCRCSSINGITSAISLVAVQTLSIVIVVVIVVIVVVVVIVIVVIVHVVVIVVISSSTIPPTATLSTVRSSFIYSPILQSVLIVFDIHNWK